jgi:DNA-binding response OmpR family regulator
MRILFVENHEIFARMAISQFLGEHRVVVTPSLEGARRLLSHQRPDAILVDYDLDDGKGSALVLELRKSGFRGLIIGVSAKEEGNRFLLEAGADAVCGKLELHRLPALLASGVST